MPNDNTLIRAIANKDKEAFSQLYQQYQPLVLRYCGRLLNHDIEAAADIADDVFFEVWQKSHTFRGDASVKSWILSIAHNKAVSFIRKNREVSLDNEDQINELVSTEVNQEKSLAEEQRNQLLSQAIEQLSTDHKAVLHLFYFSEMSIKEIAQLLSINDRTVRTRLHYAKKALVPILAHVGIAADEYFNNM